MDDAITAYAAETDLLAELLASLTDEQWRRPSGCAGWTVSDVVLHLAQSEESVVSAFDQGDSGVPYAPYLELVGRGGDGMVDAIMAAAVEGERPDDPAAVLERWQAANHAAVARLRAADPASRVPWVAAPLAPRTLAATRLSEHWIHGLDLREPLGVPSVDTDRLWHVARLAWRTLPYAFAAEDEEPPSVRLRLTSPSGEEWVLEDGTSEPEVVVAGPAGQWCRLAARRLRPDDTDLRADGPRGARVLELARTYA